MYEHDTTHNTSQTAQVDYFP